MPKVHYLRNAADSDKLRTEFASAKSLLVVGGGLIGLEVAASATTLGIQTTVIEADRNLLSRSCAPEIGQFLLQAHRDKGVEVHLATPAKAADIAGSGRVAVETSQGLIEADLVVVGAGAVPDTRIAQEAGLEVEDGICVDAQCRSSDPKIFAAGDVARVASLRGSVRLENWNHAQAHGRIAGQNAAGATQSYQPLPSFWTEQYDLYVQGVGWLSADAERVLRRQAGNSWMLFGVGNGYLEYAFGVNAQRDIAVARRMIERRVPVRASELEDPNTALQALLKAQPTGAQPTLAS
jgi:NADPH-dependent 2,4-dienoyl-CoA reductase/sulfur reductase-like enzyme